MKLKQLFSLLPIALSWVQAQEEAPLTLRVAPNGRFLQWSDGTPYFIHSDTTWNLTYAFSQKEVLKYLENRVALKFNTIQLSAVFAKTGDEGFCKEAFVDGDFAQPIAGYWKNVDWVIEQATEWGLVVAANPIWKNQLNHAIKTNGVKKCREFGRWFASRYRHNPHVFYFIGGDQVPEPTRDENSAIAEGIQEIYQGKAIIAYHARSDQSSLDAYPTAKWLTLNWTYCYSPAYQRSQRYPYEVNWNAWIPNLAHGPIPIQFGEGYYDWGGRGIKSRMGDRFMVRRQAWWNVTSGASGNAYGAESIWSHGGEYGYKTDAWEQALEYPSGRDMMRLKEFIDSIQWWKLQPDINHELLVGGCGQWRTNEFATATFTEDKSLAVIYTPVKHTLEIQRSFFADGKLTIRWLEPTNGKVQPIDEAAQRTKEGILTLSSPDLNSANDGDWILIISK